MAPFYLPTLTLILAAVSAGETGKQRMRLGVWAWIFMLPLFVALLVTPSHPILPRAGISRLTRCRLLNPRLRQRIRDVYATYAVRSDPLRRLRERGLGAGVRRVAFIGSPDDPDISLWKPIGGRRVYHVPPARTADPEWYAQRGISWVVTAPERLNRLGIDVDTWARSLRAQVRARETTHLKVRDGREEWFCAELLPSEGEGRGTLE
jgi:hypothetical protein